MEYAGWPDLGAMLSFGTEGRGWGGVGNVVCLTSGSKAPWINNGKLVISNSNNREINDRKEVIL